MLLPKLSTHKLYGCLNSFFVLIPMHDYKITFSDRTLSVNQISTSLSNPMMIYCIMINVVKIKKVKIARGLNVFVLELSYSHEQHFVHYKN